MLSLFFGLGFVTCFFLLWLYGRHQEYKDRQRMREFYSRIPSRSPTFQQASSRKKKAKSRK